MPIDIPFYRTANFDQAISPCSDYDQPSTCTISVGGGYYYYSCRPDVCKDPGIAVRSNTDVQNQWHRKFARTATKGPEIYCEETTKTLKLDPPSETANVGEDIAWIGLGIQNWTLTLNKGTCELTDSLNDENRVCRIKPGAKSQKYTVYSDACGSRDTVQGTLTIQ